MSIIRTLAIAKAAGGGGGGDITTQSLSVTANGQYTAPSGKAYTPVSVDVQPTLQQKTATENGVVTPDTGYDGLSQVTVNVSGGGGGSVPEKDVNFYDYDGTCVAAYTAAEFAALTAMPANPDRTSEGLTAQGWNWTLADAKAYVASYSMLNVGQMYITTDGKTHIHIHLEAGRTTPNLGIGLKGTADVDWGDGTAHDTLTGTSLGTAKRKVHAYAEPGDYVIKLSISGSAQFVSGQSGEPSLLLRYSVFSDTRNNYYVRSITRIHVGNGFSNLSQYAFAQCQQLSALTVPNGINGIGAYAFNQCSNLSNLNVPSSNGAISSRVFSDCTKIEHINLGKEIQTIGTYAFYLCCCMRKTSIPSGVTTIDQSVFERCYSMGRIAIPSTITTIKNNAFCDCTGAGEIHFYSTVPPTVDNANAFTGLPADCKIYVPTGSLSAYTSATNYPSSSTYTYIEE